MSLEVTGKLIQKYDNPSVYKRQRILFRKFGFKASFVGRSNRNPEKNHDIKIGRAHV